MNAMPTTITISAAPTSGLLVVSLAIGVVHTRYVGRGRGRARIQHDVRIRDLASLKPRERDALYLKALGLSYQEIGELTSSTYMAVNRRITEGRARLRRLARERDRAPGDERQA